jgi:hypothetical protein
MRLPIGIQDFANLRENDYVYVDKTMFFSNILKGGRFFIARPRRFGKSLMISTLKAIFEGRKDLFKDLWLENRHDFVPYPIIRLDFSQLDMLGRSLEVSLVESFRYTALQYGLVLQAETAKAAFEELIRTLSVEQRVVVLIDEYDKALTDFLENPKKRAEHQEILKSVYGVLKPLDAHLHLVVLTGVSKFGKLSLFSDLNNLEDISLNTNYALAFGYTKTEIESYFSVEIQAVADKMGISLTKLWERVKRWYNGYSWDGIESVYCPFSFLLFLSQKHLRSFWYETGTPTLLVQLVRQGKINPLEFESLMVSQEAIVTANIDKLDAISLMFQTGYLTVKQIKISSAGTRYTLAYPNEEVRIAFSTNLLEEYSQLRSSQISTFGIDLQDALLELEWIKFFEVVNKIFAGVPYEIFPKKESYVHSLMHLMLVSSGWRVQSQVQTALGRMDTLIETDLNQIIFEFKIGGTPEAALAQINSQQYALSLEKPVVKIGVVFDLETKGVSAWKTENDLPLV